MENMRTPAQMLDLITGTAVSDPRIRGAYLTGSRVVSSIPGDIFQDYDFVYAVTSTASFIADPAWVDVFGPRLYMRLPDEADRTAGRGTDFENDYGYLIQLADGNRIDLHLQTRRRCLQILEKGKPYRVLTDKDGFFPETFREAGTRYNVKKPSFLSYRSCCNEFWWSLGDAAKGLWREEIPYAMEIIDFRLRPRLTDMLSWYAGMRNDFSVSVGKSGKYLNRYLPAPMWKCFLDTYPGGKINDIWEAVFSMSRLFDRTGREVGEALDFEYNTEEAENSLFFLWNARSLPRDARSIFPSETGNSI